MGDDQWALFFDFDGTLVDIAERPDAVVAGPDLRAVLERLGARFGGALAIVTGRTIADIDGFLPDRMIDVLGLHGLERRIGGSLSSPAGLADLGPEVEALRAAFADRPGVLVEDKRVGFAIHWRMAPEAEADALRAMAGIAERLGSSYRIQDGKAVREIVPAGAGKGTGIRAAMELPPYRGRVPVFVGDDRTDEGGFEAVNALGGVSVKVGAGETAARYRLPHRTDVTHWLDRLADGVITPDELPVA